MKSTIIIKCNNGKYFSTVSGKFGGGHTNARAGLNAYEAAAHAAEMMIKYASQNKEGGYLMAPPEVLELVPEHLRNIAAKIKNEA